MADQIVEIARSGYWLHKARGFLEVRADGESKGQVALDDILAVIIAAPGNSISTVLIDQLAQRNIPLVLCGANYLPTSLVLPLQGHSRQFQIMQAQLLLSQPRRKRAWQQVVQAKIRNQAELLGRAGHNHQALLRLASKVRSGDPDNCEAQAARLYWRQLFGDDFRRDREAGGLNAALNYIYAVVRACVARGVSGVGLHPSLSLHHKNPQNPLNLVDDLMEPFRPIADYLVWQCQLSHVVDLEPVLKAKLAAITSLLVPIANDAAPLSLAAVKCCRSLAQHCMDATTALCLPGMPTALDISSLSNAASLPEGAEP